MSKDFNKPAQSPKEFGDFSSDDIEIVDTEDYQSDKFQVFNHQTLVMTALSRCSEAAAHEMRSGWFNEKMDHKGNINRTYVEDTRLKFIACVKSAITIMECDYDAEIGKNISALLLALKNVKSKLLYEQWGWWSKLHPIPRQEAIRRYGEIFPTFFNIELGWWQIYVEKQVDIYLEILTELHKLSKRMDFYQIADLEA